MKNVLSFNKSPEAQQEKLVSMSETPSSLSVHWRNLEVHFGGTRACAPCSGDIKAGTLVALLGPSGAGKSTLLNALCKRGPVTKGELWYSDEKTGRNLAWSSALKKLVAYVEQDDHCLEHVTVRETLMFAARLRLPKAPLAEKNQRVEDTIDVLRLSLRADSKVGGALNKGISGGERKRLMIGQELLTEPKLIALDEPTSGLDSSTSAVVVDVLRELAEKKHVSVVASLHQPSSRIFLNCHELVLLDRQGVVYRGPTEPAGDAFRGAPFFLPKPTAFSAPDWLMEIVVAEEFRIDEDSSSLKLEEAKSEDNKSRMTPSELEEGGEFDDISKKQFEMTAYGETPSEDQKARRALRRAEADRLYGPLSLPPKPSDQFYAVKSHKKSEDYVVPFSEQVRVLSLRSWKEVYPSIFDKNAIALHCGNSLLAGLMWFQLGYKEEDIWPKLTLAFAVPIAWVFFPLLSSLAIVPQNEVTLKKDLSSNAYKLSAWYLVVTTVLLAPMFVQSIIHVSVVFCLSNLGGPLVWLAVYGTVVLALMTFQSIGMFFSAALPAGNLMTCAMLYVTYCFLFTGLFVDLDNTPLPEIALPNPMLYIMSLAVHSVFAIPNRRYDCGNDIDDEGTVFTRSCGSSKDGKIGAPEILREYRLKPFPSVPVSIAVLVSFLCLTRYLAFHLLRRRMNKHLKVMRSYQ